MNDLESRPDIVAFDRKATRKKLLFWLIFLLSGVVSFAFAKGTLFPDVVRLCLALWAGIVVIVTFARICIALYPGTTPLSHSAFWFSWFE